MVPPKLTHCSLTKNPCRDATGRKSQRHSCSLLVGWSCGRLVEHPSKKLCHDNGCSSRLRLLDYLTIGLSDCFCLCNSEVHSASALLPCLHRVGLDTRLRRTRPTAWLSGNRFETYSSSSAFFDCRLAALYDGGRKESRVSLYFSILQSLPSLYPL